MEEKNKELSKKIEKEFNDLEVLSYEKMIEILNDQQKNVLIWFTEYKDILFTGNEYHYVQVRDLFEDKHTTYKSPDQDDELIEINLSKAIEKSPIEGKYYICDQLWTKDYFCAIGSNRVSFPSSVTKKIFKAFRESAKRQTEFKKEDNKKMVLKHEDLDPGKLPFEL